MDAARVAVVRVVLCAGPRVSAHGTETGAGRFHVMEVREGSMACRAGRVRRRHPLECTPAACEWLAPSQHCRPAGISPASPCAESRSGSVRRTCVLPRPPPAQLVVKHPEPGVVAAPAAGAGAGGANTWERVRFSSWSTQGQSWPPSLHGELLSKHAAGRPLTRAPQCWGSAFQFASADTGNSLT